MFDSEEITQLLNTDISTMSAAETLASAARHEQARRQVIAELIHLLAAHPGVTAEHPDLQGELDHLRTLDLEEASGPGS